MNINYYKSESLVKPSLIDNSSSSVFTYIRKDIQEETREDQDTKEKIIYFVYDEAKLTKSEYADYLTEYVNCLVEQNKLELQQQRADLDYIALISGIDLEV